MRGEQPTRFRVGRALIYPHVPVLFMLEPPRSNTGEEANYPLCIVFPASHTPNPAGRDSGGSARSRPGLSVHPLCGTQGGVPTGASGRPWRRRNMRVRLTVCADDAVAANTAPADLAHDVILMKTIHRVKLI